MNQWHNGKFHDVRIGAAAVTAANCYFYTEYHEVCGLRQSQQNTNAWMYYTFIELNLYYLPKRNTLKRY